MEKVAVFGAQKGASKKTDDIKLKLNMSGNNFGNYLIGYSIDKQVENCDYFQFKKDLDFEYINEYYDRAIIASSNFINSVQDLKNWADVIERLNMPVTSIGLGAQALSKDEKINIKPGTERYLKIASEKSHTLGVRGEFTAEVLETLGIKNTEVIGCPSAFMSLDRNFELDSQIKSLDKVLVHGNPRPNQMFYIEHLLNTFLHHDMHFLAQTESQLLLMQKGLMSMNEVGNFMGLKNLPKNIQSNLIDNTVHFDDVDLWKEFLRNVSLSIGGRFHGNMLAAQMNVPAIWVVHDTRSQEFINLYEFPHIHMDDLPSLSHDEILDEFSYEKFNKKYPVLYDNYIDFLNNNGIKHILKS